MEKICANCAEWSRNTSNWADKNAGCCDCEKFVYQCETPSDGLRYWDYEGFSAGFETGETFGCIHWKEKVNK